MKDDLDEVFGPKPLRARVTKGEAEREMVRQVRRAAADEALGRTIERLAK